MSSVPSVAVLCDIHGNLPALEAVLDELRAEPPGAVVIGGDVAAGPMPHEVLERLLALPWPVHWVRGNADRCVVIAFDGAVPAGEAEEPMWVADAWTASRLSRAERDFLAALPPLAELDVEGLGHVLFCHGTPRSDEERVTAVTEAAVTAFREIGYPDADGMAERVDPDEVSAMFEAGADGRLDPASLTLP